MSEFVDKPGLDDKITKIVQDLRDYHLDYCGFVNKSAGGDDTRRTPRNKHDTYTALIIDLIEKYIKL